MILKSQEEIKTMREGGKIMAEAFSELAKAIRPGVTTQELDQLVENLLRVRGAKPSFKGYRGFPAAICASPDDVVVHGIPNDTPLKEGQIIGIDLGVYYKGLHTDAARTFEVGRVSQAAHQLVEVTREALAAGLEKLVPGGALYDVGRTIEAYVKRYGYSVVRELVGHGVGRALHEEPEVPNFARPGKGLKLVPGMTLAVEPMVNIGGWQVVMDPDGWTIRTKDGTLSAHFEQTVAITEEGPWVLTE